MYKSRFNAILFGIIIAVLAGAGGFYLSASDFSNSFKKPEVKEDKASLKTGVYVLEGYNVGDDKVDYVGSVAIEKAGEVYRLQWNIAGQTQRGVGILDGNILSVGYIDVTGGNILDAGAVSYRILSEGKLDGKWSSVLGRRTGREVLTLGTVTETPIESGGSAGGSASVPESEAGIQKSGITLVVGPFGFFFFTAKSDWVPIDYGPYKLVLGNKDSAGKHKATVIMEETPVDEVIRTQKKRLTLEEWSSDLERRVQKEAKSVFRSDRSFRWGGLPAYRIEHLEEHPNVTLKLVYVLTVDTKGNRLVLSFSARPKDFSTYVKEFEEMIGSTTIVNKE